MTARYRDGVIVVVRTHHAERATFFDGGFERGQEDVLDFAWRGLRVCARLPFARALVVAVDGEVLDGGDDRVVLLQAFDHLDAEARDEIWVFAVNLLHAAPTLVARDIHDGCLDVRVA